MPAALAAVDLLVLCGILLLMGMLLATRYTFNLLALALNVGILGLHPFAFLATQIEGTIIAGCNAGIKALGSVAHDLWAGAKWAYNLSMQALMSFANATHTAFDYLWQTAVPNYVNAALSEAHKAITAVQSSITTLNTDLTDAETSLGATIKSTATATLQTAGRTTNDAVAEATKALHLDIAAAKTAVLNDVRETFKGIDFVGHDALNALRDAENAAIGAVRDAEQATADTVRDLLNNLPMSDINSVIAAVPLLAAAVAALEAETGLGRAECRSKIKGICGTDPLRWAHLLEAIALVEIGFNLRDMAEAAIAVLHLAEPEARKLMGV